MMTQLELHASIRNHSRLTLKRVINLVYFKNRKERMNTMFGNDKLIGVCNNNQVLKG